MGFIGALIGWLSYHLGLRADAASSTGSLHAKVKDIGNNIQKPRGPAGVPVEFTTSTGSFATALNVSGRGRLVRLMLQQTYATNPGIKITVDGYLLANATSTLGASGISYPSKDFYLYDTKFSADGDARNVEINFKTSLKIELSSNSAGHAAAVFFIYELE